MPRSASLPKFQARRVLLCTDLSPVSEQILPLARALLSKGGLLRLLHVVEPVLVPTYAGPDAVVPIFDRAATKQRVAITQRRLTATAKQLGIKGTQVKVVEADQAAKAIGAEAKRFRADLVCLSTHGRSALQRMLFGSVALKLLAHYHGRVLLLRPSHVR